MMRVALIVTIVSAAAAQPAEPAPSFRAAAEPNRQETVNPRNPDPQFVNLSVFPRELCGVQVTIGGDIIETLVGPSPAPLRDRRVHTLHWKLADEGYVAEAASGIATFQDPADLPRLTALLSSTESNDRLLFLPRDLHANFGAAAVPYLKTALRAKPGRFTERILAQQLMTAGEAEGFRYALQAIASTAVSRIDMLQSLRGQFPELKSASEDAIAAFLASRAGN